MVWVYLISKNGSDIEAEEWSAEEVSHWRSLPPLPHDNNFFTRFEDAKREAIRLQKEELAFWTEWIKDNLEHLRSLSAKDVKPKRSDT